MYRQLPRLDILFFTSLSNQFLRQGGQFPMGHHPADDVPAEQIAATSIHVHRYLRAVGCFAKASLTERYRDFDTTAAGNKKADQLENPIDDLRRDARWAISGILGIGRNTVELI